MNASQTSTSPDTEWHEGQIPDFVSSALDTLYGSLYSSLPQLTLSDMPDTHTYLARDKGQLRALFLFTFEGRSARVINEGMHIDAADADRFAEQMFQRFEATDRIEFHAISCNGRPSARPALCFALDEDILIDLPADESDYLASLGKSTRKSLRQNFTRAQNQRLQHEVIRSQNVDAELVNALIGFNRARLSAKQKNSALDPVAASRLLTLVRASGMAGIVTLNGRLCAGTLACRVGNDLYSLVNAHDPAFDALGMGNLSRHLMIVAAIRSGASRFHLMGGNFSSKRACGAHRQTLHHWAIYRDRRQMVADLPHVTALALRELRYHLGIALDGTAGDVSGRPVLRGVATLLRLAQRVRRAGKRQLRVSTTTPR